LIHNHLVYVVGPSGVGKDAILSGARAQLDGQGEVIFAHRYITRDAEAGGENHIWVSAGEFEQRRRLGLWALAWESHAYLYGVGVEIDAWMAAGATVVLNGSRAALGAAAARYPNLLPVLIEASPEVLRQRLQKRGRESADEIEERLKRTAALPALSHPRLQCIDNNGPLEDAVQQFVSLLNGAGAA
jgi:ribose 1,5-bisphosphokinase